MGDIQFHEEESSPATTEMEGESFSFKILKKVGLAKNDHQASVVMITIAVLCVLIAIIIYLVTVINNSLVPGKKNDVDPRLELKLKNR